MDALIEVPPSSLDGLVGDGWSETSAVVRARVIAAREFRTARVLERHHRGGTRLSEEVHDLFGLDGTIGLTGEARRLMQQALVVEGLSGRAYVRTGGLARTIADLDGADQVGSHHVAEALSLRLDGSRLGIGR